MKTLKLLFLMMFFALGSCGGDHLDIDKAASGDGGLTIEIPVE